MAVAYRSDTGIARVLGATAPVDISFGTAPTAGDLVVTGAAMFLSSSATPTVTDNQTNNYGLAKLITVTGGTAFPISGGMMFMHYEENVLSSGTFTLSFDGNSSSEDVSVGGVAFSGVATSGSLDVSASNSQIDSAVDSFATGTTGTTAVADSVAVASLAVVTGIDLSTITASGYTFTFNEGNGVFWMVGAMAYKILSATGTQSATFTYGATSAASNDHAAAIVVFSGSAGPPPPIPRIIVPTVAVSMR